MRRLHVLEGALAASFGLIRPQRRPGPRIPDVAYRTFRAYCTEQQITYKLARDGYILFSTGQVFAHHGDWAETLQRLQAGDGRAEAAASQPEQE